MTLKRALISLLFAVCILSCCIPQAQAAEDAAVIRDILYYYGQHQENAETDIIRLMESLSPENRDAWGKILACWHRAYEDQENTLQLPDTLPNDGRLCIIVMGYSLNSNGTMKDELIGRLQTALDLLEDYPNAYILCSGGGTASRNPSVTEADAMANWLLEQGVGKEQIIIENRAYSTEDNAINSFRILSQQYPEVDTIVLVSSDYHLRRCKVLFYAATVLNGQEDRYNIAGWAGFDAGHEGAEDPPNDAESLGPMVGLYIDKSYIPNLSILTEIVVEGNDSCMAGDPPPIAVSACYNNGFSRDVTQWATITGFDPLLPEMQTITVSYEENGVTLSVTREVTVIPLPTQTTQPTIPATTEPATVPATEKIELDVEEAPNPFLLLAMSVTSTIFAICALIFVLRKRR